MAPSMRRKENTNVDETQLWPLAAQAWGKIMIPSHFALIVLGVYALYLAVTTYYIMTRNGG